MAKSLKGMTLNERSSAIARRIKDKSGGVGYWAAKASLTPHSAPKKASGDLAIRERLIEQGLIKPTVS